MRMHLGGNRSVPFEQVIAIVDVTREKTRDTQSFVQAARSAGRLRSTGEPAKALVLFKDESGTWCYLTPVSARTLARHIQKGL